MTCPKCGSNRVYVINSRDWKQNQVRRRRECYHCKHRFWTLETIQPEDKSNV